MIGMILAALLDSIGGAVRRGVLRGKLLLAAGIFGFLALAFLAVAVDLWLATRMSGPEAAAVTGAGLAVIALLLVAIAYRRPDAPVKSALPTAELVALLGTEFSTLAKPLTVAALVAGFVLALSSGRGSKSKK